MLRALISGKHRRHLLIVGLLANVGCGATRLAPPAGQPAPDPAGLVEEIRANTQPSTPIQVNFAWTLDERGSRVRGNGVVRSEENRIRLDLFGPRGDTYLIAALVGDEYRVPPQLTETIALPSSTLLWGALGILNPPPGGTLASASLTDEHVDLRFTAAGDQQFVYSYARLDAGLYRLDRLQRAGRQGVLETVALDYAPDAGLARVHYRDWSAFRDLTLDIETIRPATTFPPSIWSPDGPR
jgi:hypothetical protein